ncbi:hypothetical protein GGX14DRAFT_380853 [Mycena pura]|uniref:F-box domain-containing protein n=1 Tax=Mycena pura TaxID=153505 RepID=A0AAD6UPE1_9AGAR|nr:hypothetical protein GGX14DRAFT_380853 [Mycena pura]
MGSDSHNARGQVRVPRLPPELELAVFQLTAWFHPEMTHTLILVCKRVCTWVEPLLYKVVQNNSTGSEDRILRMMTSKPPEYLQAHVRHVALINFIDRRDVADLLSTCTDIEDLAIWTPGDTYPALLDDMRHLTRLRHLSINIFDLFGGYSRFQLPPVEQLPLSLVNLTHLDVFGTPTAELCPFFGMLSALTHLAFSDIYMPLLMQHALDTCPALQVLVIVWTQSDAHEETPETPEITDPRFCTVFCTNFNEDWEMGAWDGEDFWYRAEAVIAAKHHREIKGARSSPCSTV